MNRFTLVNISTQGMPATAATHNCAVLSYAAPAGYRRLVARHHWLAFFADTLTLRIPHCLPSCSNILPVYALRATPDALRILRVTAGQTWQAMRHARGR